jgi:type I restriction enzyme S subunit
MNESAVTLSEAKPLPQGWQWVRLGEVCEFLDNLRIPVNDVDRQRRIVGKKQSELYPYYGANGQVGWIDDYLFDEELVLLAEDGGFFGSVEKPIAYRVSGRCWVNNHAHVLRAKKELINVDWLYFALAIRPDIMQFVSGTTRMKLNQDKASLVPVLLPPLPEQKRIAAKVRELMKDVECARTACEDQLEAAKALPSAYLRQVFESDAAKKWERRRLGEICEVVTGNTPSKNNPENYGDYLPWVKPEDLDKEMYVKDAGEHLSVLGASQARILPRGTVMVSCIGNLGKIAIAGRELATNQQINSLIPKFEVNSEYVYFCCRTIQSTLERLSASTTLKIVNKTAFASIAIPLPQLATQHQIAAELKERIASAEKLKASIEKQLDVIKALPQAILRNAFSGEL